MFTEQQVEDVKIMINSGGWSVITQILGENRDNLYHEAVNGTTVLNNVTKTLSPTERTERLLQISWLEHISSLPDDIVKTYDHS